MALRLLPLPRVAAVSHLPFYTIHSYSSQLLSRHDNTDVSSGERELSDDVDIYRGLLQSMYKIPTTAATNKTNLLGVAGFGETHPY